MISSTESSESLSFSSALKMYKPVSLLSRECKMEQSGARNSKMLGKDVNNQITKLIKRKNMTLCNLFQEYCCGGRD